MQRLYRRPAFTLVELLVVIAIIGVLVALTVPAVLGTRESARRAQCANHLKQLGVAAHSFGNAHGRFPPGYLGPFALRPLPEPGSTEDVSGKGWHTTQFTSVFVFLLSHMDHKAAADRIAKSGFQDKTGTTNWLDQSISLLDAEKTGDAWWRPTRTEACAEAVREISTFQCPSAPLDRGKAVYSATHPTAENYPNPYQSRFLGPEAGDDPGRTGYLACGGLWPETIEELEQGAIPSGVFYSRSATTPRDISDGLSTTFLFGEANGIGYRPALIIPVSSSTSSGVWTEDPFGWMGCGVMWTNVLPADPEQRFSRFQGDHIDVVLFCYADGSVRSISKYIEETPFRAQASIAAGERIDP